LELLAYHIETAICLSIFYIIYLLLFKYETFFKFNRYLLLASLALSFTIPLIELPVTDGVEIGIIPPIEIQSRITEITVYAESNSVSLNFITLLPYLYLFGIAISFTMLIFNFYKIAKIKKNSLKTNIDGCEIHLLEKNTNPFTFIKNIFISKSSLKEENIIEVVRHEKVHVRQWHTLDILLLEILKAFQWFNPVIYLFGREIREIHEYIADSEVLASSDVKSTYIDKMLNLTIGAPLSSLANNFSNIKLIKRIKMIAKPKSRKSLAAKYFMMVPAVLVLLLAFSCKDENATSGNSFYYENTYPWLTKVNSNNTYLKDNPSAFIVDEYPGVTKPDYFEIIQNMKTHHLWLKEKKAGKISVRFKIDKYGIVSEPIISQWKMADDKLWTRKRLPEDIEKDVLNAIIKHSSKYTPAIKNGEPIDAFSGHIFLLGDKSVWNRYNLGKKVYSRDTDGTLKGIEVPYSKQPAKNKSGAALISNEQLHFITRNLKYPDKAKKDGIEGTVIVKLYVETNGSISDVKVTEGIGSGCDEEALRVVTLMPKFKGDYLPKSRSELLIPIKFLLKY